MKILFLTDTHIRAKTPRYRCDEDYQQNILDKYEYLIKEAENHKVDMIIHGGDLFDGIPSYSVLNNVLKVLSKTDIPQTILLGNHDIRGNSYDHSCFPIIDNSSISIQVIKAIHHLCFQKLDIVFYPYDGNGGGLYNMYKDFKGDILVTHDMFVNAPVPYSHVLCSDFAQSYPSTKLVLSGHYHEAFDAIYNNTRFINPGSLNRLDISLHNLRRKPNGVLIDITKEGSLSVNYLEVPCKDNVFNMEEISLMKSDKLDLNSFVDKLKNTAFLGANIEERIIAYGKDHNEDTLVVEEALRRVCESKTRFDKED